MALIIAFNSSSPELPPPPPEAIHFKTDSNNRFVELIFLVIPAFLCNPYTSGSFISGSYDICFL